MSHYFALTKDEGMFKLKLGRFPVNAASAFLLLCNAVVSAQIRPDSLKRVADDDATMPTLREWQDKLKTAYSRGGNVEARFSAWYELPFSSIQKLFPGQRFFTIEWSERAIPGREKFAGALPQGIAVNRCHYRSDYRRLPQHGHRDDAVG